MRSTPLNGGESIIRTAFVQPRKILFAGQNIIDGSVYARVVRREPKSCLVVLTSKGRFASLLIRPGLKEVDHRVFRPSRRDVHEQGCCIVQIAPVPGQTSPQEFPACHLRSKGLATLNRSSRSFPIACSYEDFGQ